MSLANCKECGKLYMQNPAGICPDCYRQNEEQEEKVAEYLRKNRRATISEVHQATGVPERIVIKMIKAGRIIGDISVEYPCESCGKPILDGRFCDECSQRVLNQLKAEPKPVAPQRESNVLRKQGEGFHTTFPKR